jgi:putative ABC transport system substrate-binding protein
MRRRKFLAIGGAAMAWPFAARAQQKLPVIGVLSGGLARSLEASWPAFAAGLGELGYAEKQNVTTELRTAEGHYEKLPAFSAELVARKVDVIVAIAPPASLAAKRATATIPIVFTMGADPLKLGLIESFNHPGGNVTGVTFLLNDLEAKQLQLLRELAPDAGTVGYLVNPDNPDTESETKKAQAAARALGQRLEIVMARAPADFEPAFAKLVEKGAGALLVGSDVYLTGEADRIVALAARQAIPTVYAQRVSPLAGGLASYGTDPRDGVHQAGVYVARILKGAKPADLPVVQSTKFELVINLKTAKALGLAIPPTLLARADEVIE